MRVLLKKMNVIPIYFHSSGAFLKNCIESSSCATDPAGAECFECRGFVGAGGLTSLKTSRNIFSNVVGFADP